MDLGKMETNLSRASLFVECLAMNVAPYSALLLHTLHVYNKGWLAGYAIVNNGKQKIAF